MYIRRKVFSLGEGNIDYDYNIYQQLYSEGFDDGVDYAIEKMFAEEEDKKKKETTKEDLEREAKHASNWKGFIPYGMWSPGWAVAKHKVADSIEEGRSDDEVREGAHRHFDKTASRVNKIGAIGGGIFGAGTGLGAHLLVGKEGSKLSAIGLTAAGAGLGAGMGYGVNKLMGKIAKKGVDKNVDEAIARRKEMRESEGR